MRGNLKLTVRLFCTDFSKLETNSSFFQVISFCLRIVSASVHQLDMSLDVTACLKALSSAFCQYRSHSNEQNAKDLERQIDVSYFGY